jgi:hypothetical protein
MNLRYSIQLLTCYYEIIINQNCHNLGPKTMHLTNSKFFLAVSDL